MPETFASAQYGKVLTIGEVMDQGGQGRILRTDDPTVLVKQFEPAFITDDANRQQALKHQVERAYQTFCMVKKGVHPQLAALPSEYLTWEGKPAYLMRKAEGLTLQTLFQEKRMRHDKRIFLALALASAMQKLHAAQICHADPHPGNFMVREEDGCFTVFVLDIDGGGLLGPPGPIYPLSQPGRVYKAPELAVMGWKQLHERSLFFAPDDYALAVLLYRILVDEEGPFPTVANHPDPALHDYAPFKPYAYRDPDATWPQPWQEDLLSRAQLSNQVVSLFSETFQHRFEPQRERDGRARPTAARWATELFALATPPPVLNVSVLHAQPPPPVQSKASQSRARWWAAKVRRLIRPCRLRINRTLRPCLWALRAAFRWSRVWRTTTTR
jgi:serine/threonine protein kinase